MSRIHGCLYVWPDRGDLVALEKAESRDNFGDEAHGLGPFADPGRWFGLKLVVDTARKQVTGFVKSGDGPWVRLNQEPAPYYNPEADGTQLSIGFGTRKVKAAPDNVLEMDNLCVRQLSVSDLKP